MGWTYPHHIRKIGSYISSHVEPRAGVYMLVAMEDEKTITCAHLQRIGGIDKTGTLYIGHARRGGTLRERMGKLLRSVRKPQGPSRHGGYVYNREHGAGLSLRRNPVLSPLYPIEKLAVRWRYDDQPVIAENNLLWAYYESFGEAPPLNSQRSDGWLGMSDATE
jgi:hypothetical protein